MSDIQSLALTLCRDGAVPAREAAAGLVRPEAGGRADEEGPPSSSRSASASPALFAAAPVMTGSLAFLCGC